MVISPNYSAVKIIIFLSNTVTYANVEPERFFGNPYLAVIWESIRRNILLDTFTEVSEDDALINKELNSCYQFIFYMVRLPDWNLTKPECETLQAIRGE